MMVGAGSYVCVGAIVGCAVGLSLGVRLGTTLGVGLSMGAGVCVGSSDASFGIFSASTAGCGWGWALASL